MKYNIPKKINKFDINGLLFINRHLESKFLDFLMPIMTDLGNLGVVWIIIAIGLILDNQQDIGKVVLVTLIISTVIGEGVIKHIVRRARPFNSHNNIVPSISKPISYSFPSGHTLSSFAVSGVLSVYFTQYRLVFLFIAFLIALSRIYLYLHYPSDVMAGIIFGLLCSKLIFFLLNEQYLQRFVTQIVSNI
ncbi:phosphatase PAP2 family protein [Candidatus Clostridium stratigraminis]|uniref:Phosphatase PAP2 family protein n=1 Tax=Candidatus Clostridium stratigraminis TaxID=3381661 RepID=A0ABW8T1A1_9CLOT